MRFIHTADWQLGLRVRYIPGDAGAVVREARLQTVATIGDLARAQAADFVVVAGDVFEHHGLKPATLRKTFDVLAGYPCPVYLLPGNHDPFTPDSLYRAPLWKAACPPNVHALGDDTPVLAAPGAWILPCPLRERHTLDDPTDHLTPGFGPQGVIRVGLAHGGIREVLAGMRDPDDEALHNAIRIDAARAGGLDYLALGDWHGLLRVDDRTWYSGAPEPTRFKEKQPGYVLRVDIDAPGAPPRVEPHRVCTQTWVQHTATVRSAADLEDLEAALEALPDKRTTLLELFLEGTLDAADHARLGLTLEAFADRLLWLRRRDERLAATVGEADLDEIAADGWVRRVVDELRAHEKDEVAQNALRLLYQLHTEATR